MNDVKSQKSPKPQSVANRLLGGYVQCHIRIFKNKSGCDVTYTPPPKKRGPPQIFAWDLFWVIRNIKNRLKMVPVLLQFVRSETVFLLGYILINVIEKDQRNYLRSMRSNVR